MAQSTNKFFEVQLRVVARGVAQETVLGGAAFVEGVPADPPDGAAREARPSEGVERDVDPGGGERVDRNRGVPASPPARAPSSPSDGQRREVEGPAHRVDLAILTLVASGAGLTFSVESSHVFLRRSIPHGRALLER